MRTNRNGGIGVLLTEAPEHTVTLSWVVYGGILKLIYQLMGYI